MRSPRALLMIVLLAQSVSAAAAPVGDKPRPHRKPVEAPPVKTAATQPAQRIARPNVSLPADALFSGGIAAGGLHSTLPAIGDVSAQCRARCTQTRIFCDAQEATLQCAPRWTVCVTGCGAASR